jgi:predicted trehalose synthase
VTDKDGVLVDRWQCGATHSLWLVEHSGEIFVAPVVLDGTPRRARPGDRFIASVEEGSAGRFRSTVSLQAPVVTEERVDVDQTNESLVVNNTWIVKWNLTLGSTRSLAKERRLAERGFSDTPESFGHITWTSDAGTEHVVASVQRYLADSEDGWTWCVEHAIANERRNWPRSLGQVVAHMHNAFADTDLAHGDLHVGQILRHDDSYYVIDFDGNPVGDSSESWLLDVVSMLCSFIHVAAVAEVKYAATHNVSQWVDAVSAEFLDSYFRDRPEITRPSRGTLVELMAQKEEEEREYAQKFLPEWTYAAEYGRDFVERMSREGE